MERIAAKKIQVRGRAGEALERERVNRQETRMRKQERKEDPKRNFNLRFEKIRDKSAFSNRSITFYYYVRYTENSLRCPGGGGGKNIHSFYKRIIWTEEKNVTSKE